MSKATAFLRFGLPTLLLGLLIGIGTSQALKGQTANADGAPENEVPSVDPSGGQTFYKRISGWGFHPFYSETTFAQGYQGCLFRPDNEGGSSFGYTLELPHGAVLDYMSLYYYDTSSSENVSVSILAHDGAGGVELVDLLESAGSGGFGATGSGVFSHIVDNYNESLILAVNIPDDQYLDAQVCGVRIRYQFDISSNYLPAMLNSAVP